jgi:hypothetical protein
MKRYAVFAYSDYYPSGGWGDLFGRYETLEEAKKAIEEDKAPGGPLRQRSDHYDIVDLVTGEYEE